MFKSATQPLCRHCGKKIAKYTVMRDVAHDSYRASPYQHFLRIYTAEPVTSKDQLQRMVNEKVTSVSYSERFDIYNAERKTTVSNECLNVRNINFCRTWDGKSYVDEFFCNGDHAKAFAYTMARHGYETRAHREALTQQRMQQREAE